MPIRKLILVLTTVAVASAPFAEAKMHRSGQPSTYKSSRHSKRIKQKSAFKIRHGKIKH